MEKSGNTKAEHVRSARMWLEKAEKYFDSRADIRGELNLMLAEAEMKNLRKNHGGVRRSKGRLLAAIGIACICAGIWYGTGRYETARPVPDPIGQRPPAGQSAPAAPSPSDKAAAGPSREAQPAEPVPAAQAAPKRSPAPTANNATEQRAEAAEPVPKEGPAAPIQQRAPRAEKVMTDAQIQQAVQDARHSLRGTETKNK